MLSCFRGTDICEHQRSAGSEAGAVPASPKSREAQDIVALIPPRMLVTQGVLAPNARLIVRKAVYGLDQSPRDWAFLRDAKLPTLEVLLEGKVFRDSFWLVSECVPKRGIAATSVEHGQGEVAGWIAVYADDMLIAARKPLAEAIAQAIAACWECSTPQEVSADPHQPVRFLGIDLTCDSEGNLQLSQEAYLRDLGKRYEQELKGHGKPITPLPCALDDDSTEPNPSHEDIRRAQTLVGERLWSSIRTRPDISYSVSRLASLITRAPVRVYKAGIGVLAYLVATVDVHLVYWKGNRAVWSEFKQSPDPKGLIEGFGDASFAPEAKQSVQCVQAYAEGSLVAWTVSRQPFMAQSSCEAEMIALMELANYTVAMSYLLDELLQCRSMKQLAGDNVASLAIYGGTTYHWRTRHLRIRAKAFQERYQEGTLPARHVAGEWSPADLGTKALGGARHWKVVRSSGPQNHHFGGQEGPWNITEASLAAAVFESSTTSILSLLCEQSAAWSSTRPQQRPLANSLGIAVDCC